MPYLQSLKISSLPLKAKNHHAFRSFGGCVLFIKNRLTFYNINTRNFARISIYSHCRFLVKIFFPAAESIILSVCGAF